MNKKMEINKKSFNLGREEEQTDEMCYLFF